MRWGRVVFIILVWTFRAAGQSGSSASKPQNNSPVSTAQSPRSTTTAQGNRPAATPPSGETNNRFDDLASRIQKLESKSDSGIYTALIAAGAVLAAALLGMYGQYLTGRREERRALATATQAAELARQEALYKHMEHILEFRLKQLEEFYAPMFALLRQSRGLYDKLLNQLAQDEPTRYRPASDPTGKNYRLEVCAGDGTWQGFRLLDQLPAVRTNPRASALADQILVIGQKMTDIISEHAGLASDEIIELLGQYMAHYAILSTVDKLNEDTPYEPGRHKVGYYPLELDAKIEAGYRELSGFIIEYGKQSKTLLATLPLSPIAGDQKSS